MQIERVDRTQARPVERPEWFPGGDLLRLLAIRIEHDLLPQWILIPQIHPRPGLADDRNRNGVRAIPFIEFTSGEQRNLHRLEIPAADDALMWERIPHAQKFTTGANDFVIVPIGIWHWHGATPDSAMCHLSIKPPGQTDWTAPWKDWKTYAEGAR